MTQKSKHKQPETKQGSVVIGVSVKTTLYQAAANVAKRKGLNVQDILRNKLSEDGEVSKELQLILSQL